MSRLRAAMFVVAAALAVGPGCADEPALRIGVLLPASARGPIALAVENVNRAGGIHGRPLGLELVDVANGTDVAAEAQRLAADPGIVAVIGPETSRELFDIASYFVDAHKPIVSPSATAGGIFRAFGGKKYVWRTVESDIAQVQTMLTVARRDGARSAALIASQDPYGGTFFDWFGFFATELGMRVTAVETGDKLGERACEGHVERALVGDPDVLVAAPSDVAGAICLRRALAGRARPRVIFSDVAYAPALLAALGPLAEGMEGIIGVADPASGFDEWYTRAPGESDTGYGARAYDALLLLAYGLARSDGQGGAQLARAMEEVVDARGARGTADAAGVRDTLVAIQSGTLPNVYGAAGPLDFDAELHTDLVSSTYGLWRVQGGSYAVSERFATAPGRSDGTAAVYRTLASGAHAEELEVGATSEPPPRAGLRALVVATTKGWDNYRHQADAMAVYAKLRAAGVRDDHIVLAVADDLASDPRNPEPGVVRHVAGGPDLRTKAEVDYRLPDLASEDLWAIVRGERSARLPAVLEATGNDDVLVYLVGHAGARGLDWAGSPRTGGVLTPAALGEALAGIPAHRRVLVAVDSCFSSRMAEGIVARQLPRVMLLASSRPAESELATSWDPALEIWLGDELTAAFVGADPALTLRDLYKHLYLRVAGAHVSAHNTRLFGDVGAVRFAEFVGP